MPTDYIDQGEGEGEIGVTYASSGVNSVGSTTNWGSKFDGSLSESILGL